MRVVTAWKRKSVSAKIIARFIQEKPADSL
jgi:hypothetical protein